jgi:integrase
VGDNCGPRRSGRCLPGAPTSCFGCRPSSLTGRGRASRGERPAAASWVVVAGSQLDFRVYFGHTAPGPATARGGTGGDAASSSPASNVAAPRLTPRTALSSTGRDSHRRSLIARYARRWAPLGRTSKVDSTFYVRGRIDHGERVAPKRVTIAEWAEHWIANQSELRPRTRERYELALRLHVLPHIGRVRVSDLTVDHVAWLIAEMRKAGLAPLTIRGHLTPLCRLMAHAARRGIAAANPVAKLDKGERPAAVAKRERRILTRQEIEGLLGAVDPRHRALLTTAVFTGVRLGELLGLKWMDVDFDEDVIRVRRQLGRDGQVAELRRRRHGARSTCSPISRACCASTKRSRRSRCPTTSSLRPLQVRGSGIGTSLGGSSIRPSVAPVWRGTGSRG